MNIFIGSSREAGEVMDWVSLILQEYGHQPVRWDNPGLFPPGENTFYRLIEISKTVDGAIFIFAEDDKVWYRGDAAHQPRDNVLIEYGLFTGRLGPTKAIITVYKSPKQPSDMLGITYVDVSERRRERARTELRIWANGLQSDQVDPAMLQLMAKISEQERKVENLEQKLQFEQEKSGDYETLLTNRGVIDFADIDLAIDGHWKLLFDFDYFWQTSLEMANYYVLPSTLRSALEGVKGTQSLVERIAWAQENNPSRTGVLARKVLRLFRREYKIEVFREYLAELDHDLRETLEKIAKDIVSKKLITGGGKEAGLGK